MLQATAVARERGLDAVVMNLGGGFQDFLICAREPRIARTAEEWVIGDLPCIR